MCVACIWHPTTEVSTNPSIHTAKDRNMATKESSVSPRSSPSFDFISRNHQSPILLIRHSERVDEVISAQDYAKYIAKKRSLKINQQDESSTTQLSIIELSFDPTIAHNVKSKILQQHKNQQGPVDEAVYQAALPYPTLYPNYRHNRCSLSSQSDPPITRQGVSIAKQAGRTAKAMIQKYQSRQISSDTGSLSSSSSSSSSSSRSLLQDNQNTSKVRIYCSRLQRCIQTAYVIAKKFPNNEVDTLYISTGLALTSNAVSIIGSNNFDFLTLEEIVQLCHDMKVIDCDTGRVYFGQNYLFKDFQQEEEKGTKDVLISCNNWQEAFQDIADHCSDECSKIVVIHRESIRNLMPNRDRLRLPYCCIAYCEPQQHVDKSPDYESTSNTNNNELKELQKHKYPKNGFPLKMHALFTPNGDRLRSFVDYDPIRPAGNLCRL